MLSRTIRNPKMECWKWKGKNLDNGFSRSENFFTLVASKGFKREILYVERSYGTDEMKRDKHFRQTNFTQSSLMNFYLRAFFRIPTFFASIIREKIRMLFTSRRKIYFITRGEFLFSIHIKKIKEYFIIILYEFTFIIGKAIRRIANYDQWNALQKSKLK